MHTITQRRSCQDDKSEELGYKRRLYEMNNFKARPYKSREWESQATMLFQLETQEDLLN